MDKTTNEKLNTELSSLIAKWLDKALKEENNPETYPLCHEAATDIVHMYQLLNPSPDNMDPKNSTSAMLFAKKYMKK